MFIWTAAIVAILILSVAAYRYYTKRFDYRIRLAAVKLQKYTTSSKPTPSTGVRLVNSIHALINTGIKNSQKADVYRAVDLLKLAYGSGIQRHIEYQLLSSLVMAALRGRQPDIAAIICGAFRPMIKTSNQKSIPLIIDQLTLIAVLGARLKYYFLLAKVLESVFDAAGRTDCAESKELDSALLRSVRIIGLLALRRREYELFREMIKLFRDWVRLKDAAIDNMAGLFTAWFHCFAKSGDTAGIEMVTTLGIKLYAEKVITEESMNEIILEASKTAGVASLSHRNKVPPCILSFLLEAASVSQNYNVWRKTVSAVGQAASLTLSRHLINDALPILLPMLDTGRRLLADELKFGEFSDDYRRRRLFVVMRECMLIAELKARQQMTASTGEIISEIYKCWSGTCQADGIQKSIRRYCQLLLLFWKNTRQREARRGMPKDSTLTEPTLISEKDRKRLGL